MIDPQRGLIAVLRAAIQSAEETIRWSETPEGSEFMRRAYPSADTPRSLDSDERDQ